MSPELITIAVIIGAVVLFVTDRVSVDVVGLLIISVLVFTGVVTPEQGVMGFSNKATITVVFMFILSAALLKTGALQMLTHKLAPIFRDNFNKGMLLMMVLIAAMSAFVNNTPVVAVFIPVVIQIGHASGRSPAKMLIPLSFASIFGGTCTLIGTSTNILVSGIAEKEGLPPIDIFQPLKYGIFVFFIGVGYMLFFGIRLLPKRPTDEDLGSKFGIRDYLSEIELLDRSEDVGKTIMESDLVREFSMDILEVRRNGIRYTFPPGDFCLQAGDVLKVNCSMDKMKRLKSKARVNVQESMRIGGEDVKGKNSALLEMVITADSEFEGKNLRTVDFRRRFRAVPLAIRTREVVKHSELYDIPMQAGDVILIEVKKHFIQEMKKLEAGADAPFVLLSEDPMVDFKRKKFVVVMAVIASVVGLAAFNIVDIMAGAIGGVTLLILTRVISMSEAYGAVSWRIVFLLAGALCLGTAMKNTGLDLRLAGEIIGVLGPWGPVAVLSGIYLATSLLTELMSNNATAALMAPIAIAAAEALGVSPLPLIMAVMFAASSSFMTPVGYQTNTMVFSAGGYKFLDFIKVGTALNIGFWILATILLPLLFPF